MTLGVFILISTPSIKLFYSSVIINFLAIFILLIAQLLNYMGDNLSTINLESNINAYRLKVVVFIFVFLFGIYSTIGNEYLSLEDFIRYLSVFVALFLVIISASKINLTLLLRLVLFWGAFISIMKFLGILRIQYDLGQTYLTPGVPAGAALVVCLLGLFTNWFKSNWSKVIAISLILILVINLLTSRGRSNLLYPFIIAGVYFLLTIIFSRKYRTKYILLLVTSVLSLYYIFVHYIMQGKYMVLERITHGAENVEGEERYFLWSKSLDAILSNPLGSGINAHEKLLGFYPHNIILEVGLSFGIIGMGLILYIVFLALNQLKIAIKSIGIINNKEVLILGFLALYFFLCWNTSFDFGTGYIPLSMLCLFCVKSFSNSSNN